MFSDFCKEIFLIAVIQNRDYDKGQFSFDTKSPLYKINEISNLSSKYCYIRIKVISDRIYTFHSNISFIYLLDFSVSLASPDLLNLVLTMIWLNVGFLNGARMEKV